MHGTERRIVSQPDTVDFDRRTEGGVSESRPSLPEGEGVFCRKVRIDGLSSRKKGGDIRHVRELKVVEGITAEGMGCAETVLRPLCGHDHLVKGKGTFMKGYCYPFHILADIDAHRYGHIAQARHFQDIFSRLHLIQGKLSVNVGRGPEIILPQSYCCTYHRNLRSIFGNSTGNREVPRVCVCGEPHGARREKHKRYEDLP